GNRLGRLDPSSRVVEEFPLPAPIGKSPAATLYKTGGAWRLFFSPDNETIYFDEGFDFSVERLDAARVRQHLTECQALDARGKNPCIEEIAVADAAAFTTNFDLVHSIAPDAQGRIWYSQPGSAD